MKTKILIAPMFGLALMVMLCGNCKENSSAVVNNSVEGVWFFVLNDSVYDEIIFTKDAYWGYDVEAGEVSGTYVIGNDSMKTYFFGGKESLTSKYQRNYKDQFILTNSNFSARYERLNIDLDTAKLLGGNNDELNAYVEGFMNRKHKWESKERIDNKK